MRTTTIGGDQRYRVIVRGTAADAEAAAAQHIGFATKLWDIKTTHYAVWATVWAKREQLEAWMASNPRRDWRGYAQPGSLTFYLGDETTGGCEQ